MTLNYLLADGNSSRLEKTLVYEKQIAADAISFTWPTESAGMSFVVATARPGVGAADLETEVMDVIDDLLRDGVEEEEIEGARNRARRGLLNGRAGFGDRADAIAHAAVLRGDAAYVNDAFARYGAVARADVERVAREVLDPRGLTVLHVVPEGGTDAPVPTEGAA